MAKITFCSLLPLLLAPLASAVFVPSDLADGIYSIPFSTNTPTLISPPLSPRSLSKNPLIAPRQSLPRPVDVSCGPSGRLRDLDDFLQAKSDFQNFCDKEVRIEPSSAVVYVTGTAMAYLCNFGDGNWCYRGEYDTALDLIVDECGRGNGGEVYVDTYAKTYGGDNSGMDICL